MSDYEKWRELGLKEMRLGYEKLTGKVPTNEIEELMEEASDTATMKTPVWKFDEARQPVLYFNGIKFGDK